jgi:hypothetical protein
VLNEPRKGGLGVSLVGAVVEPGGHYCRSSDAAVLLCVRIIATAAACVVCCGVATAVNSGNGTEERRGRKETRKDGAFLAFSLSAPHVGEKPFCCRFPPHPVEVDWNFRRPFCWAPRTGTKSRWGSANRAHLHLKAVSLCCGFLRVVSSEIMGGSRALGQFLPFF